MFSLLCYFHFEPCGWNDYNVKLRWEMLMNLKSFQCVLYAFSLTLITNHDAMRDFHYTFIFVSFRSMPIHSLNILYITSLLMLQLRRSGQICFTASLHSLWVGMRGHWTWGNVFQVWCVWYDQTHKHVNHVSHLIDII